MIMKKQFFIISVKINVHSSLSYFISSDRIYFSSSSTQMIYVRVDVVGLNFAQNSFHFSLLILKDFQFEKSKISKPWKGDKQVGG